MHRNNFLLRFRLQSRDCHRRDDTFLITKSESLRACVSLLLKYPSAPATAALPHPRDVKLHFWTGSSAAGQFGVEEVMNGFLLQQLTAFFLSVSSADPPPLYHYQDAELCEPRQ